MSLLELKNVAKEYDSQVVLERLNVSVEEGEFITIVGASGCGKTTFLKMLLGTESPSKGTFLLDGKPLAHLTVIENVMLAEEFSQARWLGRVWGRKRAAIREQARMMLKQVGLLGAQDKYPHQLSGGMQQRLALAQALMKQPRILLLDEPFGALDPGIRAEMHVLISSLWERHKLTIFMITHDLKEGFSLGSRLWVFDKVRHDPQAPEAYGASITYDIPLDRKPAGSVTPLFPDALYPVTEQPAALFGH